MVWAALTSSASPFLLTSNQPGRAVTTITAAKAPAVARVKKRLATKEPIKMTAPTQKPVQSSTLDKCMNAAQGS